MGILLGPVSFGDMRMSVLALAVCRLVSKVNFVVIFIEIQREFRLLHVLLGWRHDLAI